MELSEYIKIVSTVLSGFLGLLGYMEITKQRDTNKLSTIGKIGLCLLILNIVLLVIVELSEKQNKIVETQKSKEDYENLLDSLNNILSHTKKNFTLIDSVRSNLKETDQSIGENLLLQRDVSIAAERLLTPIKSIDFQYTVSYDLEDTTFVHYIDYLNTIGDSLLTGKTQAELDIERTSSTYAIDTFPFITGVDRTDSSYTYRNAEFRIHNGIIWHIHIPYESPLLPRNEPTRTILNELDMYVIFNKGMRKGTTKSDEVLMLQLTNTRINSDFIQNNNYLNLSEFCRLSLTIDFSRKVIKKDVKQPFVNIRHKGSKVKSYKDLAGQEIWIKDNNIADRQGWLPSPIAISKFSLWINSSVYVVYDSTYQVDKLQNPNPIDFLTREHLD